MGFWLVLFLFSSHFRYYLVIVLLLILAVALPFSALKFAHPPHHLFYILSCFEDLFIFIDPMSVRLENIHTIIFCFVPEQTTVVQRR